MTDRERLERRYRRLLACYPRAFRRDHGHELLGVLMTGAENGRWAAGPAAVADLIAGGLRMRVASPRLPAPVRLMYVGAAVELATLITIVATLGDVHSAIRSRHPGYSAAQWHAELTGHLLPLVFSAGLAVGVWLWLAWANGRGSRWARLAFAAFATLNVCGLLSGLTDGSATYARADLAAGAVLCAVGLAGVALLLRGARARDAATPF